MNEEPKEYAEETYRMVMVHQSGAVFEKIISMYPDHVDVIVAGLMKTGSFREVRLDPAPDADVGILYPPEKWNVFEPLPVDDELPPLDRPKIP